MNTFSDYLQEIEERSKQGLSPKPIDGAELLAEIIGQIKDANHPNRAISLDFFIFNITFGIRKSFNILLQFREIPIKFHQNPVENEEIH